MSTRPDRIKWCERAKDFIDPGEPCDYFSFSPTNREPIWHPECREWRVFKRPERAEQENE